MTTLQSTLQAFREETSRPVGAGEVTLRRILTSTTRHRRMRMLAPLLVVSFVATTSVAFAVVHWGSRFNAVVPTPVPSVKADSVPAAVGSPTPAMPSTLARSPVSAPLATPTTRAGVTAVHHRVRRNRAVSVEPTDPFAAEDDLFASAQREHLESPGSANELAGWEEYLRQYPHGRFEPEARYRRAVSLAGLRRWNDARAAFAPFAEGAFGDYRSDEASQWLRAVPQP